MRDEKYISECRDEKKNLRTKRKGKRCGKTYGL
jgi:hypothetical protein